MPVFCITRMQSCRCLPLFSNAVEAGTVSSPFDKVSAMLQILLALAGLMGAAGIVLAAAGAHGKPGAGLDSAGYLLINHAVAVLAAAGLLRAGRVYRQP